jgi:hypothetical protein
MKEPKSADQMAHPAEADNRRNEHRGSAALNHLKSQ